MFEQKDTCRKAQSEILHGRKLALSDPESVWGWHTPAGRIRAERRAGMISAAAQLQSGMKVLEIGCGTGLFTEKFSVTGVRLLAVDISGDLLMLARGRGLPEDQVIFMEKRFEDCDIDGPFDAVIGSSILHHLDITPALSKIHDLLKPGGIMCFAEPNMLNPQIMLQKHIPWLKRQMGDSPDETAFNRFQLYSLLRKTGFSDIAIRPFDWLHPATPLRLIRAVIQMGGFFEKTPLIREMAGSLLISSSRP